MKKIGQLELNGPLILAPMAGVTTAAFRPICMRMGASLCFTEMISDKGLIYRNQKTLDMLQNDKDIRPIGIQLFGSSAETLKEALKIVEEKSNYDLIDINMGCPVNKVIKSGSGSALLLEPDKISDIIKALKEVTNKPISIKIRAGWDHSSINCAEVAKLATDSGASMITIHGRTRSDLYRGSVNLDYIKQVRDATDIFVVGNGDIKTTADAKRMLDMGCDAVMIGRAALGNPWIFKKITAELNGDIYIPPTNKEVIDTLLEHARNLMAITTEHAGIVEMRTHSVWYFKQLKKAKSYRLRLVNINTYEELKAICDEYLQEVRL